MSKFSEEIYLCICYFISASIWIHSCAIEPLCSKPQQYIVRIFLIEIESGMFSLHFSGCRIAVVWIVVGSWSWTGLNVVNYGATLFDCYLMLSSVRKMFLILSLQFKCRLHGYMYVLKLYAPFSALLFVYFNCFHKSLQVS